jgi:hypothetical protein
MKEIMTITDIALHPEGKQTLFATSNFFRRRSSCPARALERFLMARRLISDYNNPNALFVQAARFLLLEYHLKHHQQATAENRHCWRTRPQS